MAPRFLVRMATQVEMQEKWYQRDDSNPPAYQFPVAMIPIGEPPLEDPLLSPLLPNSPPSYRSLQQPCTPPPVYRQHQYSLPASDIDLHSFPDGSTIMVVGACTRQGMHIIDRLLEQGYRVRGVVSTPRESAQTSKYFETKYDRDYYNSWIIPDLTRRGAFDQVVKTCAGVVFVSSQASPIAISRTITVARVRNALTAAMREANMGRFVYCSPQATTEHPSMRIGSRLRHGREESGASDSSCGSQRSDASDTSRASVEVAIWDCVDGRRPDFTLDIVTLPSSFGTILSGVLSVVN